MSILAKRLLEAMQGGTVIDIDSVPQPDMAEAYAIQADILRRLNIEPKGRKLALREDGLLSAPLLSALQDDRFPFEPGLRMEVELALVLGGDLPVRATPYSRDDVVRSIGAVHIGVEFIRSRYVGGAQGRTPLLIADLMSNVGYRLGPKLDIAVLDPGRGPGSLTVAMDGNRVFDAPPPRHPDDDAVAGLVAYANSPKRAPYVLSEGVVITTGSLCGALALHGPARIDMALGGQTFSVNVAA